MLAFANVTKNDVVYDLGCGDGRIVIAAARKYGARGVGIDIDPDRIAESEANAKRAGVERLVKFRLQDALTADVSDASVVMLYLLSSSNMKLRPLLTKQLRPGARIVSQSFGMGDWTPEKIDDFKDGNGTARKLFLWTADGTVTAVIRAGAQGRAGARPLRGLGRGLGLGGAAAEVAVHVEQ